MHFIRNANLNDVETIRQLAHITWQHAYGPILEKRQIDYMLNEIYITEKIDKQIRDGFQTYVLLLEDEKPVAFASYCPRTENPEIYKLHKLYCLPETQGKGYGKVLIDEVAARTIAAGINTLELNVNRHNKAKTFYEKMGFVVIYEENIPIGKYFMNDYVMRKEL